MAPAPAALAAWRSQRLAPPPPLLPLLLAPALLLLLLPRPCLARRYSGSLTGDRGAWPFLARFAFGADASGAPVGTASLAFAYPGAGPGPGVPSAVLYMFDDSLWSAVYPAQGCAQATNQAPGATGFASLPLAPGAGGSPATELFVETARPHLWFFTLAAQDCATPPLLASYTLDLRLADGSQLGYDEIGMPAIYGAFLALNAAVLLAHALAHYFPATLAALLAALCGGGGGFAYGRVDVAGRGASAAARAAAANGGAGGAPRRFAPAIVRWFTASLSLFCAACLLHACDWAAAASNGVGAPAAGIAADFLRIGSLMALWTCSALVAMGYGVVSFSVNERNWNWLGWLLLVGILMSYLALVILFSIGADPNTVASDVGELWPAVALLALTLGFAVWWASKIRATIAAEANTTKKALLLSLQRALGLNFFVLPVAFFVGAVTPAWERTRVASGIDLFLITGINCAVAYALLPHRAEDAFRVYDGSTALALLALGGDALLDGGGGSGDFHAAMNEAYSYSDMGAGGGGGAGDGGGAGAKFGAI